MITASIFLELLMRNGLTLMEAVTVVSEIDKFDINELLEVK